MKSTLRHIISSVLWIVVGIYAILTMAFHVPSIQKGIGETIASELSELLGTKVSIQRVDLGFLNRFIIDGATIYDQEGKRMFYSTRLSARFDILPLFDGRISISSAQVFGLDARLYRKTADSPLNCQFVIDSLSSNDTTKTSIDLHIASLVLRNGAVKYDQLDEPNHHKTFSPKHIDVSKISSHIIIYAINEYEISTQLKNLSLKESSGIELKKLSLDVDIKNEKNKKSYLVRDFQLKLPNTSLSVPQLFIEHGLKAGRTDYNTLTFNGAITSDGVTPSDFQAFTAKDLSALPPVKLQINGRGDARSSKGALNISTGKHSLAVVANVTAHRLFTNQSTSEESVLRNVKWTVGSLEATITQDFIAALNTIVDIPHQINNIGNITLKANAKGTYSTVFLDLGINTTNAGAADIQGTYSANAASIKATLKEVDLATILENNTLGTLSAEFGAKAQLTNGKPNNANLESKISTIVFNNYSYNDLTFNGKYTTTGSSQRVDTEITSGDDNLNLNLTAQVFLLSNKIKRIKADAEIHRLRPATLNISDAWGNSTFELSLSTDIEGSKLDNVNGHLAINNLKFNGGHKNLTDISNDDIFTLGSFIVDTKSNASGNRESRIYSDFLKAEILGKYTFSSLPASLVNIVKQHLKSVPGLPDYKRSDNDFTFQANINSTELIRRLTGADFRLKGNAVVNGWVNDDAGTTNLYVTIPSLSTGGVDINDFKLLTWSPDNSLRTTLQSDIIMGKNTLKVNFEATALNDILKSSLNWYNVNGNTFAGTLNTTARGYTRENNNPCVNLSIEPSDIHLGDTLLRLHSRDIIYYDHHLSVDSFAIENDNQHLYINGLASRSAQDSMIVDLKDLNVKYILDMVNFHSVKFAGKATGKVIGKNLFSTPEAYTHLEVSDFEFQDGNLGTLSIDARLNNEDEQIDIHGHAYDDMGDLGINGYVSPQRSALMLDLTPKDTPADLLESFCGSFMDVLDLRINGNLKVYGPFKSVNMSGSVIANGNILIKPLNCTYWLSDAIAKFDPDHIHMEKQTMSDKNGHTALLTGSLRHKHLSQFTYDFSIDADHFLAYDFNDFGESTFYGTGIVTGNCSITGNGDDLSIDVKGSTEDGSIMVYNASSPDAISNQEFITWHSSEQRKHPGDQVVSNDEAANETAEDMSTNIRMNFQLDVTEGSTLKLLMDDASNDYIALHGTGSLQAKYYNKGSFDLFGKYNVNSGQYRMTIQNVIRRDFEFLPGSSIVFNGDPYIASLDLQALYSLKSVPLSDLSLGSSFSNNNVRVDCLMNIDGTPEAPKVDFDLDLPTVNTDAKQMIYSLMNSEEEKRQQVLYLLAVGRFYALGANNAASQQATSGEMANMAMQSILSGTLSQQIGNIISSFLKSNNWTVGANISPGNDGFSNAEYEGIFNGSLLNNRLLINGQIGYRDNAATSQQGFIGDFDIRYLLLPNGNLAVKVYNQANDRYFTRNSMNTQGVGLVLKTDFNNWKNFFLWKRRSKEE